MPLPDAEDPKTSNLYAQLRSQDLQNIEPSTFDQVKNPVHINAEWEDEARRLKLWGELSGMSSSSGPQGLYYSEHDFTATGYASMHPVEVGSGGVYQLEAVSAVNTGVSGTVKYGLYWGKPTSTGHIYWFYMTTSDSNPIFTADSNWAAKGLYDDNYQLYFRVIDMGGASAIQARAIFAKVR